MTKHIIYNIIFKDETLFYLVHNTEEDSFFIELDLNRTNKATNKEISKTGAEQILKKLAWLKVRE